MDPFIPIGKMSKKKRKELYAARRGSWGDINPVTRKSENPKAYNRRKTRKWSDDTSGTVFFVAVFPGRRPEIARDPGLSPRPAFSRIAFVNTN